jgi:MFS family permease
MSQTTVPQAPSPQAYAPAASGDISLAWAWWTVAVLTVLYTSSFIDRTILGLLVAPIRRDLGISDTGMSLLQGFSFAVFYTFLGLPAGRLADRGSRKALIAWGAALWSAATAVCGFTASFWQLFLARVGVGVGEATLTPAAHSLMADLFPPQKRGRAFSIYHMGVSMGQGAALVVGGLVIRAVSTAEEVSVPLVGMMRSWQVVFLVVGLPGLLLALLALTMREPERAHTRADFPSVREAVAFLGAHRPAFVLWLAGVSLYAIVLFGFPAWMPTVMVRKFAMTPGEIGPIYGTIVLVCGPLGMLIAGSICDWLLARNDRDAYWKVVTAVGALAIPAAVLAPLMPTRELTFVVVAFEALIMHGFTGVSSAALAAAVPPRLRGQITALNFFFAALMGFGIGPTFIAMFTDFVYRSDAAVGWSLATASGIVLPIAVAFMIAARRPFAGTLREVAAANAAAGVR